MADSVLDGVDSIIDKALGIREAHRRQHPGSAQAIQGWQCLDVRAHTCAIVHKHQDVIGAAIEQMAQQVISNSAGSKVYVVRATAPENFFGHASSRCMS